MMAANHAVGQSLGLPYLILEPFGASVQMVGAVVDGELIGDAVYLQLALAESVGETSVSPAGAGAVGKP